MSREPHYKIDFALKPHPLQREIIDHPARFKIAAIGRQWGKSWMVRYMALDRAINRRQRVMWVSPAIPAAITHWQQLVNLVERSKIPVKAIRQARKEIEFYGGGYISIRSAVKPDNLRGDSLDLIIMDEAAFYPQGEYIWNAVLMPQITATGGQVVITTTPNGRNWVYELFKKGLDPKSKYYKSWTAPSSSSPYQDKELLDEIRTSIPKRRWEEEYLAMFLADSGGVFVGTEKQAKVLMQPTPIKGRVYFAGVDWGKADDFTVFTVVDLFSREQVYGERFTGISTKDTVERIARLMQNWQPRKTFVEKNGIGEYALGLLRSELTGREDDTQEVASFGDEVGTGNSPMLYLNGLYVKPVHMDNEIKRDLIERLAADIEYERIALLTEKHSYGETQLSEMSTYQQVRTKTGLVTYEAADEAHDDTVMALALAYAGIPRKLPSVLKAGKGDKPANPFKSRHKKKWGKHASSD